MSLNTNPLTFRREAPLIPRPVYPMSNLPQSRWAAWMEPYARPGSWRHKTALLNHVPSDETEMLRMFLPVGRPLHLLLG